MRLLEDVSLLQIALAAHYQTGSTLVFASPSDYNNLRRRAYDDSQYTVTKDSGESFTIKTENGELTIARDDNEPDYDWRV